MTDKGDSDMRKDYYEQLNKIRDAVDTLMGDENDPIAEVYGKPFTELVAPDGWGFVIEADGSPEFRLPESGERFLTPYGTVHVCEHPPLPWWKPRLILRRKRRRRWVLEKTGEVRKALFGEWFFSSRGEPHECLTSSGTDIEVSILQLTEVTEEAESDIR